MNPLPTWTRKPRHGIMNNFNNCLLDALFLLRRTNPVNTQPTRTLSIFSVTNKQLALYLKSKESQVYLAVKGTFLGLKNDHNSIKRKLDATGKVTRRYSDRLSLMDYCLMHLSTDT